MTLPEPFEEKSDSAVLHPGTGEVVSLNASTDTLAEIIDTIREHERALRNMKSLLAAEITRRMDEEACWTVHAGPFKVTGQSPDRWEYDTEALHRSLRELSAAGMVSVRAAEDAISVETVYKPRVRGINNLLKLGGRVAEVIETCRRRPDKERYVKVERSRSRG